MSLNVNLLLDGVAATGASTTRNVQNYDASEYGIFQATISGTATVTIEGRLDRLHDWVVVDTFTASDASRITLFPEMRANVTSYSSGTVRASLAE